MTATSLHPQATMNGDDLHDYIGSLTADEQRGLAVADVAIDKAMLLHHARERRGLTIAAAAARADVDQRLVNDLEQPGANISIDVLHAYLAALGNRVDLTIVDPVTDEPAGHVSLPSTLIAAG